LLFNCGWVQIQKHFLQHSIASGFSLQFSWQL
jgi:hypothetical protein